MKRMIFLDYDNTLNDSDIKYVSKLNGFFNMDGAKLWDILLNKIHMEVHRVYPERHDDMYFHISLLHDNLGKDMEERDIIKMVRALEEAERECWENPSYFCDVFDFLEKIIELKYSVCMTTGPNSQQKGRSLEAKMSTKIFDRIFGEDILGCIKTDPIYYKRALQISGADPHKTVTIGDTLATDVIPAKKVGIKTIWLNRKKLHLNNQNSSPDYEVYDLYEALNKLNQIFENKK